MGVVSATPWPLYPWERPGTHCTEGWMGPRAGLDGCGKSRSPPGFDPRAVQPVAQSLHLQRRPQLTNEGQKHKTSFG